MIWLLILGIFDIRFQSNPEIAVATFNKTDLEYGESITRGLGIAVSEIK